MAQKKKKKKKKKNRVNPVKDILTTESDDTEHLERRHSTSQKYEGELFVIWQQKEKKR